MVISDIQSMITGASWQGVGLPLGSLHAWYPLERSVSSHFWLHHLPRPSPLLKSWVSHWKETTKGGVHAVYCRKLESNALRMHCVCSMSSLACLSRLFLRCLREDEVRPGEDNVKKCRRRVSANHVARINIFLSSMMHKFHSGSNWIKLVLFIPAPLKWPSTASRFRLTQNWVSWY